MNKKTKLTWFGIWTAVILIGLASLFAAYFGMENRDSPLGNSDNILEGITRPTEALVDNVYLIIIDGLRADTVDHMPYLQSLAQEGAWGTMVTQMPTYSRPAYARIITGANSSINNINMNSQERKLTLPNLYDLAHNAQLRTGGSLYFWFYDLILGPPYRTGDYYENRTIRDDNLPIQYGYFYDDFDYFYDDQEIFDYGTKIMLEHDPNLLLIHTMEVDIMGHDYGGLSRQYINAAIRNDNQIKEFVAAIPDPDNSIVIITADHGHRDTGGHGGPEPDAVIVPLVIVGKDVINGELPRFSQLDLAPTISAALGLPFSPYMEGKIMKEAFDWPAEVVEEKVWLLQGAHTGFAEELYELLKVEYPGMETGSVEGLLAAVNQRLIRGRLIAALSAIGVVLILLAWWKKLYRSEGWVKLFKGNGGLIAGGLITSAAHLAFFHFIFFQFDLGYTYSVINALTDAVVKPPVAAAVSYLFFLLMLLSINKCKMNFRVYAAYTAFAAIPTASLLIAGAVMQGGQSFVLPDFTYHMLLIFSSFHLAAFALLTVIGGAVITLVENRREKREKQSAAV